MPPWASGRQRRGAGAGSRRDGPDEGELRRERGHGHRGGGDGRPGGGVEEHRVAREDAGGGEGGERHGRDRGGSMDIYKEAAQLSSAQWLLGLEDLAGEQVSGDT